MLRASGPIAVVAPGHAFDPNRLEQGLQLARNEGLQFEVLPDLLNPHRYFAAPDDQRGAQLIEALTHDRFEAVWLVRGGSGMSRLLPKLQEVRLRADRPLIGFSDATALFCGLHRAGAGPLVHAPVLHSLAQTDEADQKALWATLRGDATPPLSGSSWAPGTAEGWLCGGNVCVLASMCGTPWQLDARGAILVLEEVGEAPYRLDRNLQQLVSAGVFDGVCGVALGQMVDCQPPEGASWELREIFLEHLAPLRIPVLADLPIGHGSRNHAFPWGATARIQGHQLSWEAAGPLRIA